MKKPPSPHASVRRRLGLFDDDALEAASSRGLLRRAIRDTEAGKAAIDQEGDDEITLGVDGETVRFENDRLQAAGLIGARCSCSATGICRHILAGVLFVRGMAAVEDQPAGADEAVPSTANAPADPSRAVLSENGRSEESISIEIAALDSSQLARSFGRAVLRDAEALLAGFAETDLAVTIRFEAGKALIDLPGQPTVHYMAGSGPATMISKGDPTARASKVRHAAALLALRRRAGVDPAQDGFSAQMATRAAGHSELAGFLDHVCGALEDAGRFGLSTPSEALADGLFDLALSSRADALPRLSRAILQVAGNIRRKATKEEDGVKPLKALEEIADAYAIATALKAQPEDARLRGENRATPEPLDDLVLVGHGLSIWHTPSGARGVTAFFRTHLQDAPTPSAIYSATLARAGGQDPDFEPRRAAQGEPVFGLPLTTLATSVFRLTGARCGPDGRLSIGRHGHAERLDQSLAETLLGGEGDASSVAESPLLFDVEGLAIHLKAAVLAARGVRQPAFLDVAGFGQPWFDALSQSLALPVRDRRGNWVELTVSAPEDAMLRVLDHVEQLRESQNGCAVAVTASSTEGEVRLTPTGILARTKESEGLANRFGAIGRRLLARAEIRAPKAATVVSDELVLLDLLPRIRQSTGDDIDGASVLRRLTDRLKRGEAPVSFSRHSARLTITDRRIAAARDDMLALAELGGRLADDRRLARLGDTSIWLEAAGLAPLAEALRRLASAPEPERPAALLRAVHLGTALQDLAPRMPLLERNV